MTESSSPPRPASGLLHDPELRREVFELLAANWPADRRTWNGVREHLADGLRLPGDVKRRFVPGARFGESPAPARFRPESVDLPTLEMKAIILPLARPVLLIQDNDFAASPTAYWRQRLDPVRDRIRESIRAVGRVELRNHDQFDWNGTAWLVRADVAVTNAHVARAFAAKRDGGWVFRTNALGQAIGSLIDFRAEHERSVEELFPVTDILYLEEHEGPDIALLRLQAQPARGNGLSLAERVESGSEVVTIGYPKFDSSVSDPDVLVPIFGGIYDVKRLSPGVVTEATPQLIKHDCTTLGGSSGSAVIELASGHAVGLHFGGGYRLTNFAVPAPVVAGLLTKLGLDQTAPG